MKTRSHCPPGTLRPRVRCALVCLLIPLLVACASPPSGDQGSFEAAPSRIDSRVGTATIEDYIIALPPFAYHEESVRKFKNRVIRARADESLNDGKEADYLYIGGDGTWPPKEFTLDRDTRTLTIHVFSWEPGIDDYTEIMKRVPGGWIKGTRTDHEKPDSEGKEQPDQWVFAGQPVSTRREFP
jgi:hypothetical protein